MTRVIVYAGALVAFLSATALTIASNLLPHWVSYVVTSSSGSTFYQNIGLHKSCSSEASPTCRSFPHNEDCSGDERYFCSMWRTTGFLMSFAIVAELATLVGFMIIMGGGKFKREFGWKILGGFLVVVSIIQFCAMSIVAYLVDNDEKFIVPGWRLDRSWYLCTVSGGISILCALGLILSAFVLPPEAGYEFLDDPIYIPEDE